MGFDFQRHGALAEDDVGVVVGGDEDCAGKGLDFVDEGFALGGCGAGEVDLGAVGFCGGDFGRGRDCGHDYVGGCVEGAGCEGEGLGVVTCGECQWKFYHYFETGWRMGGFTNRSCVL